jgi:hypothetical protein
LGGYPFPSLTETTLLLPKKEAFILSSEYHSLHGVRKSSGAALFFPYTLALLLCCAILIGPSACDAAPPPGAPFSGDTETRVATQTDQGNLKQRQIAFLNRIRKADPERRTIERAVFNEQNDLGLILNRSVEMDKIPALMRSMLAQMARVFPGQDLTILAYTPSNPPRKIGTARLNARTRDMTYTAER